MKRECPGLRSKLDGKASPLHDGPIYRSRPGIRYRAFDKDPRDRSGGRCGVERQAYLAGCRSIAGLRDFTGLQGDPLARWRYKQA